MPQGKFSEIGLYILAKKHTAQKQVNLVHGIGQIGLGLPRRRFFIVTGPDDLVLVHSPVFTLANDFLEIFNLFFKN